MRIEPLDPNGLPFGSPIPVEQNDADLDDEYVADDRSILDEDISKTQASADGG